MASPRSCRRVIVLVPALALTAACGSSPPVAPSPTPSGTLAAPTGFNVFSQQVTLTGNEIVLDWFGIAPGYRVLIGSASRGDDVASVSVTAMRYTFVVPRTATTYYARVVATSGEELSAPTPELTITTLDLRHVIDALFFNGGPMSEFRAIQPDTFPLAVWPDGTRLDMPVSRAAGESVRAAMQRAIDDYESTVDGAISGTTRLVDDDFLLVGPGQLPPFTIAARISARHCPALAAGCASPGPAPLGTNATIVTFTSTSVSDGTVTHELGHANGLFHIRRADSNRPEFRFLMSSPAGADALSQPERAAIAAVRASGLRAGATREQALAADLVLPYTGGASVAQIGRR